MHGDGDAKKVLEELKKDLDKETITTDVLSKNASEQNIQDAKTSFLDYISNESGVK